MGKLTPSSYVEAPQRSPGLPNKSGTHAIFIQTSYSFENHASKTELRIVDLRSGEDTILLEDDAINGPVWLADGQDIAWLSNTETGNCDLKIANVQDMSKSYKAGTFPGSASCLKVRPLEKGKLAFALVGKRDRDGHIHNPKDVSQALSSAKYYTSNFVRHYDSWTAPERNTIFYGLLRQDSSDKYSASLIHNALPGDSKLECPIAPFGATNSFDISHRGIVFIAKEPSLDASLHTKCNLYYLEISDWDSRPGKPTYIHLPGLEGAADYPTFSPNGDTVGLLKMSKDGREAEQNRIILVKTVNTTPNVVELLGAGNGDGSWDLTPDVLYFQDDENVLFTASKQARNVLYRFPLNGTSKDLPTQLSSSGAISHVENLGNGKLLITGSSLVDSGFFGLLNATAKDFASSDLKVISSLSKHGKAHGLSQDQIEDFSWAGDDGHQIHGLLMKPSDFISTNKYPVCFLVHGGPQGAALDAWDNYTLTAQIFAEAGYLVLMPNFTGSRGYGQKFMDRIRNNWGGSPYLDLLKCFEHVDQNLVFADTARAVAGGMSYGGFMMNWIQGQDLGRKFKAVFTLSGIYSTMSFTSTDELFFIEEDLQGLPWNSKESYQNWTTWDPSRFAHNWSTPNLIVHCGKDYRVSIDHGLAAFNTLQARGIDSALLYFEDESHVVEKPENLLVLYDSILNFINQKVGLPLAGTEAVPIR